MTGLANAVLGSVASALLAAAAAFGVLHRVNWWLFRRAVFRWMVGAVGLLMLVGCVAGRGGS